jgi:hypothetical protein
LIFPLPLLRYFYGLSLSDNCRDGHPQEKPVDEHLELGIEFELLDFPTKGAEIIFLALCSPQKGHFTSES